MTILVIISSCGKYIPLKYVESMDCISESDDSQHVIDKLADECIIGVQMRSGRNWECSMKRTLRHCKQDRCLAKSIATSDPREFFERHVLSSWLDI